jgi:hypothetical protein
MDRQPARLPPPNGINAFLDTLREVEYSICEEPFSDTHAPIVTACNHVFGMHCLETWARWSNRGHNRCPNCRGVLFNDGLPLIEDEENVAEAARTMGMAAHPLGGRAPAAAVAGRAGLAAADDGAAQLAAAMARLEDLAPMQQVMGRFRHAPRGRNAPQRGVRQPVVIMRPHSPARRNRDEQERPLLTMGMGRFPGAARPIYDGHTQFAIP